MADKTVKGVMTLDGVAKIDYTALANLPTIDSTVISGSNRAVQGGAVYTALQGKLDKTAKAADSALFGGQAPTYYATASSVQALENDLTGNVTVALENLQGEINNKAPNNHASTATTYGVGNGSNYGHIKLSDSTSSTSGVSGGIAATPAAVKSAYDRATKGINDAAAAQAVADAAQSSATDASTKVNTLITDITAIKYVTSLPASPNANTLYLIKK